MARLVIAGIAGLVGVLVCTVVFVAQKQTERSEQVASSTATDHSAASEPSTVAAEAIPKPVTRTEPPSAEPEPTPVENREPEHAANSATEAGAEESPERERYTIEELHGDRKRKVTYVKVDGEWKVDSVSGEDPEAAPSPPKSRGKPEPKRPPKSDPRSLVQHFTETNFTHEVIHHHQPVVVDFTASWCGPCRHLAPVINELANRHSGKIRVGKVDFDDNRRLVKEFGVRSIPTILLFRNGVVVGRFVGAGDPDAIRQAVEKLAKR